MGTFFSAFIGKAGLYLAMVMICLIAMAVIARNWSCRESRHRDPKVVTAGPYKILSVDTGASITVAAGRKDKRTNTIQLQYVQAPATGKWFQLSIDHLKEIAGESVTVQYEKHGLFRGTAEESKEEVEARGPMVGIVFGHSGIELNLDQVNNGYADCTEDAPKLYRTARNQAKKLKTGIWSKQK
jgi:hypothetical protein